MTDLQSTYVTALKNTHSLELEALQAMERQVERLERYPQMKAILEQHIEETKLQRDRLETALDGQGASPSSVKEGALGLAGNLAAIFHAPAKDEILKNVYADHALENYEIAAYRSLIAIAKRAGDARNVPALEQSLAEEEAMAERVAAQIEPVTATYLELTLSGADASR
ncbi:ferritin-like domain-containing protein [Salinarimonas ramus]|uniref:YciE/YciF family protein n=1 Tax=Salinarimonas ramus TaxID=690164 RepID=A0A917QBR9_9HYPH|nr:ferritin-like domain-containing protein [Salinarimonas ramus]GGK42176.1 YciE/YciF family protein [Salinarimonas ramus]